MKRILLGFIVLLMAFMLVACSTDNRLAYYNPPPTEEEPEPTEEEPNEEEPVPTQEELLIALGYQRLKDDYAIALIPYDLLHESAEDVEIEPYILFSDGGEYINGIWYKNVGNHLHIYTWNEDDITIDFYYPIVNNLVLITSNTYIDQLKGDTDESN